MNATLKILMPVQALTKYTLDIIENVMAGAGGLIKADAMVLSSTPPIKANDITITCEYKGIKETDVDLLSVLNTNNLGLSELCLLYHMGLQAKATGTVLNIDDLPIDDFLKQMT